MSQIEVNQLSVIVPVYNEAGNVLPLAKEIEAALKDRLSYEIIFVDDASSDATVSNLKQLTNSLPVLRVIQHKRNAGQSAAVVTGVKVAKYPWIATLDGDRQNHPNDLLKLIQAIQQSNLASNQILCMGFREKRNDSWIRKLSSKIANKVRTFFLKDDCPDSGCGIKLFSRDLFLTIPHFKNCHRFLPALCKRSGAIVLNVAVSHRERTEGKSKYGISNRLWAGIVDLIGVSWLMRRPTHVEHDDVSTS